MQRLLSPILWNSVISVLIGDIEIYSQEFG